MTTKRKLVPSLNTLSEEVTRREGKKLEISIAQVKEVISVLGERWRSMLDEGRGVEALLEITGIVCRCGTRRAGTARRSARTGFGPGKKNAA